MPRFLPLFFCLYSPDNQQFLKVTASWMQKRGNFRTVPECPSLQSPMQASKWPPEKGGNPVPVGLLQKQGPCSPQPLLAPLPRLCPASQDYGKVSFLGRRLGSECQQLEINSLTSGFVREDKRQHYIVGLVLLPPALVLLPLLFFFCPQIFIENRLHSRPCFESWGLSRQRSKFPALAKLPVL